MVIRGGFVGCVAVGVLLVSACSSGGSVSGPEVTVASESSATDVSESVDTTVVEREGLGAVLDGEPPSTTVSADVDEQAAADVVHWHHRLSMGCLDDTSNCVIADFEEVASGRNLRAVQFDFTEKKKVGITAETNLPPEQTIFWARKSASTDKVIGVLECQRNYFVTTKPSGEIVDDTSGTYLLLRRAILDDDGRWRISDSFVIKEFQSATEGGDTCLTFDGSEADSLFDDLMQ